MVGKLLLGVACFTLFCVVQNSPSKRTGHSESWCCEITPSNKTQTIKTVELEKKWITNYTQHINRRPCNYGEVAAESETNSLGFTHNICHDIHNITFMQVVINEVPKTKLVITPGVCPHEHLKCCSGYELLGGQCVASGSKDDLQELIAAGLIG